MENFMSSRRSFVKATGATLALGALAGLAGCAPRDQKESDTQAAQTESYAATSADNTSWDAEYDVVIVGGGAAGNAAAVTVATEGNGATCTLLEKGTQMLGNSFFSAGRCIYADDKGKVMTYLKGLYGDEGTVDEAILEAFADGLLENKEWVGNLAPVAEEFAVEEPGAPSPSQDWCYPEYGELEESYSIGNVRVGITKDGSDPTGPRTIPVMLEQLVQTDYADAVDYRKETTVTSLVQDSTGRIVGVVAEGDKGTINIKANKGVIMACGGFENDPQMLQNYLSMHQVYARCTGNTGDGHRMCQKVGADMWHMHSTFGPWPSVRDLRDESQSLSFKESYGIYVGDNGLRFMADGNGNLAKAPGEDMRLSSGNRHGHFNVGGTFMNICLPETMWMVCDSNAVAAGAFGKDADPIADGSVYSADTIEELAEKMGVDAENLSQTVAQWNEYCDAGKDLGFGRYPEFMKDAKIVEPPFIAAVSRPMINNTDGGPRRNENAQIVDPYGDPIPGLYGTGEFGSIWSHLYQGGGNIAECVVFSRIAARHILES